MSDTLDLFGFAAPSAPRLAETPRDVFPRRPMAWEKLLAATTHRSVTVLVSTFWTREALETLNEAGDGRHVLFRDGRIEHWPPDPGQSGRVVFLTIDQARDLHRRAPLVPTGRGGTHCVQLRFAGAGEAISETLNRLAGLSSPDPQS